MNEPLSSGRSTLYAVSPIGVGTPDIESLLSYFYRLAATHCVSAGQLIAKVAVLKGWKQRSETIYRWFDFNLNGHGDLAARWSHTLSELTGVERLEHLTLMPWRNVIAQRGLTAMPSRWCPHCFARDRAEERTPYFRLIWDVAAVDVCATHGVQLTEVCPDCGRNDSRNSMSYVVPGWCSSCGAFLGDAKASVSPCAGSMWKASQVGAMLAAHSRLEGPVLRHPLIEGIRRLSEDLSDGKSAVFARRLGLNKSTVHYWLAQGGTPAITAHLRIASQTGVRLVDLLLGKVAAVRCTPATVPSLSTLFPDYRKRVAKKTYDWGRINDQLEALGKLDTPVSVVEAARQLDTNPRYLYQHANKNARVIGARWKEHYLQCGQKSRESGSKQIEAAIIELMAEGKSPNLRLLRERFPGETMTSISGAMGLIKEVKNKMGIG